MNNRMAQHLKAAAVACDRHNALHDARTALAIRDGGTMGDLQTRVIIEHRVVCVLLNFETDARFSRRRI
ncbi:MAG: hypothetical protein QM775_27805 [Pirellulales bacterium]